MKMKFTVILLISQLDWLFSYTQKGTAGGYNTTPTSQFCNISMHFIKKKLKYGKENRRFTKKHALIF